MPRLLVHAALALVVLGLGAVATVAILQSRPPAAELDLPGPRPVPVDTLVLEARSVPRPIA